MSNNNPKPVSFTTSLVLAGLSNCAAATCTNPIDVLKVRLQVANVGIKSTSQLSLWKTLQTIIQEEGYIAFYQGLIPSLLRESTYSAIRLGLYEPYKNYISQVYENMNPLSSSITLSAVSSPSSSSSTTATVSNIPSSPPPVPFSIRFLAGACSGMTGAILTNPVDIIKVRLQARTTISSSSGPGSPRSFLRMMQQEFRGIKEETSHILHKEGKGIQGLWQGSTPNVTRAALLTASQLGSYDTSKTLFQSYLQLKEGILLHFSASMIAGVTAAIITSPVDTVKTRLMIQASTQFSGPSSSSSSIPLSKGMIDGFRNIIRYEGFWSLYKGFNTQWIRIGPHTTITLLVYEQLRKYVGMKPV